MYLKATVAALLIVSVRSQLCGFKSNEECKEDLDQCRDNVTQTITARLADIPAKLAEEALQKFQRRSQNFFKNPFGALLNNAKEDSQDFESGVEASTALTRILQGSIQPLLRLIKPSTNPAAAVTAPVRIILQTFIVLKNFTDDQTLRNNSQVEKILDMIIPNIRAVNDDGIRCGADAVGGLLQYPLRGIAFVIGKILDYMMNCYSIREQAASPSCQSQTSLVDLTLSVGIWLLQTLLSFIDPETR